MSKSFYPERIHYGLSRELKARLIRAAEQRGRAPGEMFRMLLERGLDNIERGQRAAATRTRKTENNND